MCYLKNNLPDVSYSDNCKVLISDTYSSRRKHYDFKAFYAKLKKHHVAINSSLHQPVISKGSSLKTVYFYGAPEAKTQYSDNSEHLKFHAMAISDSLPFMIDQLSDRPVVMYGILGIILLIIALMMWMDQHHN